MSEETKAKKSTCPYDGLEVTDELGRKITLRKPSIMDKYELNRALGEDANIPACVGMMAPLLYVAKIDGAIFVTPKNYIECKAGLNRLKEEGVVAVHENIFNATAVSDKEHIESLKK